jgi:hypothetical protein
MTDLVLEIPILPERSRLAAIKVIARRPPVKIEPIEEADEAVPFERREVVARRIDVQMKLFASNENDAVVVREGTLKSCSWSGVSDASDRRVERNRLVLPPFPPPGRKEPPRPASACIIFK